MHLVRTAALALLLTLCQASLLAAPADPLPLGPARSARFDEKGVWSLDSAKGPLLTQCGLRLWTREGFLTQANARAAEPPTDGVAGRAFHGVLRVGTARVHYWQTATPVHGGLLITYAIGAGLAEGDEVAAGFDLPLGTYRGARCTVAGEAPVVLPVASSPDPRLVEKDAAGLTVARDGLSLAFLRRPTGKIIVQDGRQWHNPHFQVLLYASPCVSDPPAWRSITFLLATGGSPGGPVLGPVVVGPQTVACYDVHEAEARFWAPYESPYDDKQVRLWADVRTPSGRQFAADGFLTRDFVRSRVEAAEHLAPTGIARWHLRITPAEPGPHSYVVNVATPSGTAASKPHTFVAQASKLPDFLKPPTRQTRYIEHADGRPWPLIGHNYCWPPRQAPTYAAEAALARMARHGINATRLWLCSWGIQIEGSRPDSYQLDQAWRLDHILTEARRLGIRVQLCLDNFNDLTAPENAPSNPYLMRNGGPCREPKQFFTSPEAKEQYRRRVRYLVARYAPYTSLLAWELFNEIAYASDRPRHDAVVAWTTEAGTTLADLDPYGHPVTVGVGLSADWEALWRLPQLHVVQAHTYVHRPIGTTRPPQTDAAALVLKQVATLAPYAKPLVLAEFGFLGTAQFNPLNEADQTGIHLHNAIWAAALGGCAGTPMSWWWDTYLAQRDLYYHYAALARFLHGEALPGPHWNAIQTGARSPVLVLGFKSTTAALLWMRHRDNHWYRRVVEGKDAVQLGPATIELPHLAGGRYRIEWWNTYDGEPVTHTVGTTRNGTLLLRVPGGFPDIACKVRRLTD